MPAIATRILTHGAGPVCDGILRSLPDWFGIEEAIQHYVAESERLGSIVAEAEGKIAGCLTLVEHGAHTSEILVMAVRPEFHRRGIGRALAAAAEQRLRRESREFLTVKTLSAAHGSREYALSRAFYFGVGFRLVEEFPTLWGEGLPCILLIKRV